MLERVVVDTSFLVNIKRFNVLQYLCKVFSEVLITPEVWNESFQFQEYSVDLPCLNRVTLSIEEQSKVNDLHNQFTTDFPGKHFV